MKKQFELQQNILAQGLESKHHGERSTHVVGFPNHLCESESKSFGSAKNKDVMRQIWSLFCGQITGSSS